MTEISVEESYQEAQGRVERLKVLFPEVQVSEKDMGNSIAVKLPHHEKGRVLRKLVELTDDGYMSIMSMGAERFERLIEDWQRGVTA